MSDTSSTRAWTHSPRPGAVMGVPRPDRAVVRGFDRDGVPLVIEGAGYFARCLAHESDHVNGHVYLDRLSGRERRAALGQMADRRDEVFARRAANVEALQGGQGTFSA